VTAIGINALMPIVRFQLSMLRMWADSIERFAGNYQKGLEKTATIVEEQSDKERAALIMKVIGQQLRASLKPEQEQPESLRDQIERLRELEERSPAIVPAGEDGQQGG
jgi:hypothetical protein